MSSKLRCGNCGNRALERLNFNGVLKTHWKDYPLVHLTTDLELWHCPKCDETPYESGDPARVDEALEASVRDQASQFIDIIRSKANYSTERLARSIGITPEYLSSIRSQKRTPSFAIWNVLKAIAADPVLMLMRFDPETDPLEANLLLRKTGSPQVIEHRTGYAHPVETHQDGPPFRVSTDQSSTSVVGQTALASRDGNLIYGDFGKPRRHA